LEKCDYLQQSYSRTCKIVGEKGNLVWDFNENIVWLYTKEKRHQLFKVKNYNINNMYIEEIKYFLNCVEKQQPTFNDIKIAAATLKYCLNR